MIFPTDDTRQIITEHSNQYPDLIKPIFQKINVGPATNWFDLLGAARGKYIAYFEGDDYWTDNFKLQNQVDFLWKAINPMSDVFIILKKDLKMTLWHPFFTAISCPTAQKITFS